jgi:hypothetical protein
MFLANEHIKKLCNIGSELQMAHPKGGPFAFACSKLGAARIDPTRRDRVHSVRGSIRMAASDSPRSRRLREPLLTPARRQGAKYQSPCPSAVSGASRETARVCIFREGRF